MTAMNGPGKYDSETTWVRERTGASGVALIILGGDRGAGFAVQGTLEFVEGLPELLERVAADIRRQRQ